MRETWTILALAVLGGAKKATVRHRMPDGSERIREYGWPATITRDEIIRTLDALHAQVVAEPPAGLGEDLDLVGQPREV